MNVCSSCANALRKGQLMNMYFELIHLLREKIKYKRGEEQEELVELTLLLAAYDPLANIPDGVVSSGIS